ncbi:Bacterial PH domain protein [Candidatus Bilamarchaeum dharawalense]|uniref:Bacterial PH domain protein n=1 Tax=Candidatus Bilamarchaeum dharawalense TaxID=2885759 RepID=A0A5E4LMS0_9ARCH|nr:Bacterial PH domain protein [Candidatus Bilamarchaeum dharawalense]
MPAFILIFLIWTVLLIDASIFHQIINKNIDIYPYGIVISVIILVLAIIYVEVNYRHFYYEFKDNGLRISHGIIEKKIDQIPYTKIQHIRAERTFFEYILGLVHIHIEMAGIAPSEAQPSIPGVPLDAYEEMIDFLKNKGNIDTNNPEGTCAVFCPPVGSQEELLRHMLEELKIMNQKLDRLEGTEKIKPLKKLVKKETENQNLEIKLEEEGIRTHL